MLVVTVVDLLPKPIINDLNLQSGGTFFLCYILCVLILEKNWNKKQYVK